MSIIRLQSEWGGAPLVEVSCFVMITFSAGLEFQPQGLRCIEGPQYLGPASWHRNFLGLSNVA